MDSNKNREQMQERSLAQKALTGAGLNELARGVVDPVEQMNDISLSAGKTARSKKNGSEKESKNEFLYLFILALLALTALASALR